MFTTCINCVFALPSRVPVQVTQRPMSEASPTVPIIFPFPGKYGPSQLIRFEA